MKPYYDDGKCVIYHGDCRHILQKLDNGSVELVLTDPPYGLNYNNGDLANNWEAIFGGDVNRCKPRPIAGDGPEEANKLFADFLIGVYPLIVPGGCCCCCCGGGGGPNPLFAHWALLIDHRIGFKQAVVWDKGGLGMGVHYRRNYEFVLIGQKKGGPCIWNGGKTTPNIVRINKIIPSADQHPTLKPVKLMAHFVRLHSNHGGVVLDPFMGSGTTLRAAKDLGRRAIGIEIEEKYCEIAAKRLEQEVMDFGGEKKVPLCGNKLANSGDFFKELA